MRLDLQALLQPVDFAQNVLRAFEQTLARRRKPYAALDAIKQQKAQFVLEMLDLPRQRRLRDAQIVAGFPKILPPCGLNEIAELAQIHFSMMPIFDQTDDNSTLSQSNAGC
jgi:hypothetical protein